MSAPSVNHNRFLRSVALAKFARLMLDAICSAADAICLGPRKKKKREVNVGAIQKALDAGKLSADGTLDHDAFMAAGLARGGKDGVRILGKGRLSAKLAVRVAGISAGARQAIEGAGGSVEVIEVVPAADKAKAKKGSAKKAKA